MPVFNAATTVGAAVASIRTQTFTDWELLAVDDGSTDGTPRLLRDLTESDSRVRLLERPHSGVVAAHNTGLAAARGQLIARMDADDESLPDRLAAQMEFLEAHPDVGLVGSLVEFGGDRATQAGYALHVDWLNSVVSPDDIALNRFVESPLANPSLMFRRELIAAHGSYREGDFPEDYELLLRWLDAGVRMAKVPRILLRWNDPPTRLTRHDPRYEDEAFYRIKAVHLARWLRAVRSPGFSRSAAPSPSARSELPDVQPPEGGTPSEQSASRLARAEQGIVAGRPILVWGAGRLTRRRVEMLEAEGARVMGFIDIDPRKLGRKRDGREVIPPDRVPPPCECFVLGYVAKRGARELVRKTLRGRSFVEGRDFLMAA